MSNANLIERLRNFDSEFDSDKILDEAADALELEDKRIAEEREQHDIMMERGAEKLAEAERKLDVAREALKQIPHALGHDFYAAATTIADEALAQIGGEYAR